MTIKLKHKSRLNCPRCNSKMINQFERRSSTDAFKRNGWYRCPKCDVLKKNEIVVDPFNSRLFNNADKIYNSLLSKKDYIRINTVIEKDDEGDIVVSFQPKLPIFPTGRNFVETKRNVERAVIKYFQWRAEEDNKEISTELIRIYYENKL